MTDHSLIIFSQATTPAPQPGPQQGSAPFNPMGINFFVMMAFIIGIFYFMAIRPESRRKKEHQKLLGAIKPGDRVITTGGIHGIIANVKDKTISLRVADNVKIELQKGSVQTVLQKGESPPETSAGKAEKS